MEIWVRQLGRGVPPDDIVADISARWSIAKGEDRYELGLKLETFLVIARRYHEALQLLNAMMEEFPDDIRLPTKKAFVHLYFLEDFEEALEWIDVALERAYRQGCLRRDVLGYKARILLKLGRGDVLSDVLEEIMSLKIAKGDLDIGRERDFVDRAPPGLIRNDVLERYNEFRPKRAGDSTADEPPRFEPPEEAM